MTAGRPPKYQKSRSILICLDEKDLQYLDDRRHNIPRGTYLIEKMYGDKGNDARIVATLTENKQLKQEIQELKQQILFANSKLQKAAPVVIYNPVKLEQMRNELFEKSNSRGAVIIAWNKGEIEWKHFIERYKFNNRADAEVWLKNKIDSIKNNNAEVKL